MTGAGIRALSGAVGKVHPSNAVNSAKRVGRVKTRLLPVGEGLFFQFNPFSKMPMPIEARLGNCKRASWELSMMSVTEQRTHLVCDDTPSDRILWDNLHLDFLGRQGCRQEDEREQHNRRIAGENEKVVNTRSVQAQANRDLNSNRFKANHRMTSTDNAPCGSLMDGFGESPP